MIYMFTKQVLFCYYFNFIFKIESLYENMFTVSKYE